MEKNTHSDPRIGIDIGRVIMAPVKGGRADTSFLRGDMAQAMRMPPSPGALEGVRDLVAAFAGQAWLISKAGPTVQAKTMKWFDHWDFYATTGLPKDRVRFCLRRWQKAEHCREVKITHFIDDRLDVLEHLRDLVPRLYLFGEQPGHDGSPDWVTPVLDWRQTTAAILHDLGR